MITIDNIFNENTINIFTDGSIIPVSRKYENYIGCAGCIIVQTNSNKEQIIIDHSRIICRHATNNITELRAIYLGLKRIIDLNLTHFNINLFSDSQLCIYSLTEWIFTWKNDIRNYMIYNSSGNPVLNQQLIMEIINLIYSNQIYVKLYHQKGHVTGTKESLLNATNVFIKSNKVYNVEPDFIRTISDYNNMIDQSTKQELINFTGTNMFLQEYPQKINPIHQIIDGIDFNNYKKYIMKG